MHNINENPANIDKFDIFDKLDMISVMKGIHTNLLEEKFDRYEPGFIVDINWSTIKNVKLSSIKDKVIYYWFN